MGVLEDMLNAMNDPAMRHAAVVHLPLALSLIGIPFLVASAIATKSKAMRWSALLLYAVFACSAWLAMQTGEDARGHLTGNTAGEAFELVDEHEEMGEWIWIFAFGITALIALSAASKPALRRGAAWTAVLGAAFTAGWAAVTAHHGGSAVYLYAAGTKNLAAFKDVAERQSVGENDDDGGEAGLPDAVSLEGLDAREAHFVVHVLPILESSCQRCHNPNRARRSAQLDLTTRTAAMFGGRSGPAIIAGKPDESVLIHRVSSDDEEVRMPPGKALTPEEIEALRQWIADGAVWVQRPAQ